MINFSKNPKITNIPHTIAVSYCEKTAANQIVSLTFREIQVIQLTAEGKSLKEVARAINLSARTIEQHIINVKNKLNCSKITKVVYLLTKNQVIR